MKRGSTWISTLNENQIPEGIKKENGSERDEFQ